jgi:hypothetical protein
MVTTTTGPDVVHGTLTITPTPASMVMSKVDPTAIQSSLTLTDNPAEAVMSVVAPTVVVHGNQTITPVSATMIMVAILGAERITSDLPISMTCRVVEENAVTLDTSGEYKVALDAEEEYAVDLANSL